MLSPLLLVTDGKISRIKNRRNTMAAKPARYLFLDIFIEKFFSNYGTKVLKNMGMSKGFCIFAENFYLC
jgi:hypothetical protein